MENPEFKIPLLSQKILDGIVNKYLDIPYCDQSLFQILDIYLPDDCDGPYPVIVHFHGGAFLFGTQRDVNFETMLRGLKRGYAVVSVQYRMSLEARFPALIYDAKAAIRWIRANARTYSLDPTKIAVWGPSAGGFIVSMLGVTANNPAFEDLSMGNAEFSSAVDAVVDWCGPCGGFLDMDPAIRENNIGVADHNDPLSPESRIMGAPIATIAHLIDLASPWKYAHKDVPPFLIHHGEADPIVPIQQSAKLAEAIANVAGEDRVRFQRFPGQGHHGEPWYDTETMSDLVLDFIDSVLRPDEKTC